MVFMGVRNVSPARQFATKGVNREIVEKGCIDSDREARFGRRNPRQAHSARSTMRKYITATVVVEKLIEENRSLFTLFIQGDKLALLIRQLSACDRETAILEREVSHLEGANQRLRLQIQQRDLEIYRLRALAQLVQ